MARPFVFVLHHHQPTGNLPEVMQAAYARCYQPVLEALEAHPSIRVTLHFSGALLEWLIREAPEFVERVQSMAASGQAELLGGAFYDPILPLIPDNDVLGQIEMMALCCERYFGVRPEGAWLAERVYAPDLPRLLEPAGVGYTFVDDRHFARAGLDEGRATGRWVTERCGHPISVFPIAKRLRYAIPFAEPAEVIRTIVDAPGKGALVYADDAEKLGFWPNTQRWVFEEGWLSRFFGAVEAAQAEGLIQTTLPRTLMALPPEGRVYLTGGGYEELAEWAGGDSFSGFLARYPEADRLHKKMLRVSDRLQGEMEVAIAESETGRLEGDVGDLLGTAQRDLYRGQCGCVYWHGLFGGIYLGHLRRATYRSLIHAEGILDRLQQGDDEFLAYERRDVDLDDSEEVVLSNRALEVIIKPSRGGVVTELDDKRTHTAVADAMTRHAEPYHADVEPAPIVDERMRALFVDRLLPIDAPPAVIRQPDDHELSGLADCVYEVEELDVVEEAAVLRMRGRSPRIGLAVEKTFRLPMEGAALGVHYVLENVGDIEIEGRFVVELTTTFVGAPGDADGDRTIDDDARLALSLETEGRIEAYGLEGLTRREDGLTPTLLGRVQAAVFELTLAPGARREFQLDLKLDDLRGH